MKGEEPNGKQPGTEKYYVMLPKTIVSQLPNHQIMHVRYFYPQKNGGLEVWLQEEFNPYADFIFIFSFDTAMRCTKVSVPDPGSRSATSVKLPEEVEKKISSIGYLEELRRGVRYWDGEEFVSMPTMNRRYNEKLKMQNEIHGGDLP